MQEHNAMNMGMHNTTRVAKAFEIYFGFAIENH